MSRGCRESFPVSTLIHLHSWVTSWPTALAHLALSHSLPTWWSPPMGDTLHAPSSITVLLSKYKPWLRAQAHSAQELGTGQQPWARTGPQQHLSGGPRAAGFPRRQSKGSHFKRGSEMNSGAGPAVRALRGWFQVSQRLPSVKWAAHAFDLDLTGFTFPRPVRAQFTHKGDSSAENTTGRGDPQGLCFLAFINAHGSHFLNFYILC